MHEDNGEGIWETGQYRVSRHPPGFWWFLWLFIFSSHHRFHWGLHQGNWNNHVESLLGFDFSFSFYTSTLVLGSSDHRTIELQVHTFVVSFSLQLLVHLSNKFIFCMKVVYNCKFGPLLMMTIFWVLLLAGMFFKNEMSQVPNFDRFLRILFSHRTKNILCALLKYFTQPREIIQTTLNNNNFTIIHSDGEIHALPKGV